MKEISVETFSPNVSPPFDTLIKESRPVIKEEQDFGSPDKSIRIELVAFFGV